LRKLGNRAAHGEGVQAADAVRCVREAWQLARWLHVTFLAGKPADFVEFKDPPAEGIDSKAEIKRKAKALAEENALKEERLKQALQELADLRAAEKAAKDAEKLAAKEAKDAEKAAAKAAKEAEKEAAKAAKAALKGTGEDRVLPVKMKVAEKSGKYEIAGQVLAEFGMVGEITEPMCDRFIELFGIGNRSNAAFYLTGAWKAVTSFTRTMAAKSAE
jgi:beta-glucosidase-like glycosyl hydrolase